MEKQGDKKKKARRVLWPSAIILKNYSFLRLFFSTAFALGRRSSHMIHRLHEVSNSTTAAQALRLKHAERRAP